MKTLKHITLVIFLLGSVMGLQAQELERYKENGKYGFKDNKDNIVIPAKYDDADLYFKEGIAKVKLNDKHGCIDKTGKEVIPVIYDEKMWFENELVEVKLNGKGGVLDKTGKVVIPIVYDNASIVDGFVIVKNNAKDALMDKNGNTIIDFKYEELHIMSSNEIRAVLNEKHGLITSEDKVIIPFEYSYLVPYKETTYMASKDTAFVKWGLISKENKIILPFNYSWNWPFSNCCDDELQPVMLTSTKKWTFSDPKGKFLTDFKYDWSFNFMGNIAPVLLNRKYGFVNKKGVELCSPRYDVYITYYTDSIGLIPVNVGAIWEKNKEDTGYEWTDPKGGKWGFINQEGKEVIPVKYDSVELFEDGVALVNIKGKWGIIDEKGKELVPAIYDKFDGSKSHSLPESDKYKYHVRSAIKNGKSGFLDYNTFEVVVPFDYDEINDVYGIAVVKKGNKYGYYDIIERKEIIPVIYDAAEPFYGWGNENSKSAKVKLDGREFTIDYFGNEIKE